MRTWKQKAIPNPRSEDMDSAKPGGYSDGNVPSLNHPDAIRASRPGDIDVLGHMIQ
jgi:hypothetical protein